MLEVERLRSGYGGIPVLADLSLKVSGGEFVGILGHNGMGKTTLLRALIGILPATAGEIRFDGAPITRASSHRACAPGHRLRAARPRHLPGAVGARQPPLRGRGARAAPG